MSRERQMGPMRPQPVPVPSLLPLAQAGGHLWVTLVFRQTVLLCGHRKSSMLSGVHFPSVFWICWEDQSPGHIWDICDSESEAVASLDPVIVVQNEKAKQLLLSSYFYKWRS